MSKFTVDDYLQLAEVQHSPRPRFMAVLRKYLEDVQAASDIAESMHEAYSLDTGVGKQLTRLGEIIGVSRDYPAAAGSGTSTIEDDNMYRLVLRAAIARNSWDGSFHSFADTWNEIFAGQPIYASVEDNMDMSCEVTISGDFNNDIVQLIANGYVFPKPMGVKMTYVISGQGDRTGEADVNAGANFKFSTGKITIQAIWVNNG